MQTFRCEKVETSLVHIKGNVKLSEPYPYYEFFFTSDETLGLGCLRLQTTNPHDFQVGKEYQFTL